MKVKDFLNMFQYEYEFYEIQIYDGREDIFYSIPEVQNSVYGNREIQPKSITVYSPDCEDNITILKIYL